MLRRKSTAIMQLDVVTVALAAIISATKKELTTLTDIVAVNFGTISFVNFGSLAFSRNFDKTRRFNSLASGKMRAITG